MGTTDSPLDGLYWRDEILQILYWLRGEGLGDAVIARDLVPFLGTEEAFVQKYLEQLAVAGYAERLPGDQMRYRLTEPGVKEGGRRFADEFAGLTGQAHMECNDPDCVCKTQGPEACESHNRQPQP